MYNNYKYDRHCHISRLSFVYMYWAFFQIPLAHSALVLWSLNRNCCQSLGLLGTKKAIVTMQKLLLAGFCRARLQWVRQLLELQFSVCACMGCALCIRAVQAITCTFMHGFENNVAQLFSLRRRSAIWNICSDRLKVKWYKMVISLSLSGP